VGKLKRTISKVLIKSNKSLIES